MYTHKNLISLKEAIEYISSVAPIGTEDVSIANALGRVLAEDVYSASDCPSVDSSLKDGFAVISSDIERATKSNPVVLRVVDTVTAGEKRGISEVIPGTTVRIMTGSPMPRGATSVLSSEFAIELSKDAIQAIAHSEQGRNVLRKGEDIESGQKILLKGTTVSPLDTGLMAAAGINTVKVFVRPRVAIAATGTELVAPGSPIGPGEVAASNLITLEATLKQMGIEPRCYIFKDSLDDLKQRFQRLLEENDVLLTCGGVLDGDKDFTVKAMEELGVDMLFRRVRIGPGKGICMGRLGKRLIFNLPGGPPSNYVAGIVLAVPGIKRLMGSGQPFPPRIEVELQMELKGRADWTQFTFCNLGAKSGRIKAFTVDARSRLLAMARAHGLIELPEGVSCKQEGEVGMAWVLRWPNQPMS